MEFLESLKGCAIRSLNLPRRKTQKVNKQKEENRKNHLTIYSLHNTQLHIYNFTEKRKEIEKVLLKSKCG